MLTAKRIYIYIYSELARENRYATLVTEKTTNLDSKIDGVDEQTHKIWSMMPNFDRC